MQAAPQPDAQRCFGHLIIDARCKGAATTALSAPVRLLAASGMRRACCDAVVRLPPPRVRGVRALAAVQPAGEEECSIPGTCTESRWPGPGADVGGVSPVRVQMWEG